MKDAWYLLDREYVYEQSPGVRVAHERASNSEEYGVNFYEFINTSSGLEKHAQAWWDSLPQEQQVSLLRERAERLRETLEELNEALATV